MTENKTSFAYFPVDANRWGDLEKLFGPRGACAGCWCMFWRLKRADFSTQAGDGNRQKLRELIEGGAPVGVLAYAGEEPVGWCAAAPREDYPALERSRVLRRVDDRPVWSITCFFTARRLRRKGLTEGLLRAAVAYARQQGATLIEGYPIEPQKDRYPDAFAYTGFASTYQKAGFSEAARFSERRPIFRLEIGSGGEK
jgi:GNAT superfamily N-acetyltransferase